MHWCRTATMRNPVSNCRQIITGNIITDTNITSMMTTLRENTIT